MWDNTDLQKIREGSEKCGEEEDEDEQEERYIDSSSRADAETTKKKT